MNPCAYLSKNFDSLSYFPDTQDALKSRQDFRKITPLIKLLKKKIIPENPTITCVASFFKKNFTPTRFLTQFSRLI